MRTVFFFLTGLAACAAHAAPKPERQAPETRTVRVCVVNDKDAPVSQDVIDAALMATSVDYAGHVGVAFVPDVQVTAPFRPSGWPTDTAFALRAICPDASEIRVVFSDRFVEPKDASMTALGDGGQMAGDAHPYYGFVVVYSADERWNVWDPSGERALLVTMRHEFGHLFGLEHDPDKASFMHTPSSESEGRWTPDVTAAVRKERMRRWYPRR